MEKRYYYRLLGLREDASISQVKEAYQKKMQKLKGDDYSDDPEYVARKQRELRLAYSVLTGASAPESKAEKTARFEKWKDALDGGEDAIEDAKKLFQKGVGSLPSARPLSETFGKHSHAGEKEKTYYAPHEAGSKQKQIVNAKSIAIITAVLVLIFSAMSASLINEQNSYQEDYNYSYDEDGVQLDSEIQQRIDEIQMYALGNYNFDGYLDQDAAPIYAGRVEKNVDTDMQNEIWENTCDLLEALEVYNLSGTVEYLTKDDTYWWNHSDLESGLVIAEQLMGAPSFDEIAGQMNLYREKPILDYVDYFKFLTDVAHDQTNDLLGEEAENEI